MPHCLVLGCKSGSGKRGKETGEPQYTTVSLPKPPDIRLKWLEKINRLDYLTYSNQGRFMLSWSTKKLQCFFMSIFKPPRTS